MRNKIAAFRQQKGISLSQLAKAVGVSRPSMYAIEGGDQVPKVYLALAIASTLGVGVDQLFSDSAVETFYADDFIDAGAFRACLAEVDGRMVIRRSSSAGFGSVTPPADAIVRSDGIQHGIESEVGRSDLFIDGCDPVLGLIAARSVESSKSFRVRWFYGSNRSSLAKLHSRSTHCALVHGDVGNAGRQLAEEHSAISVPFGTWELALCFPPGNPKNITSLTDLLRDDVKFASRDEGSGVRVFLEMAIGNLGADLELVSGFRAFADHYKVAAAVGLGLCDAGVIPVSIALEEGLEFISVGVHESSLLFSKSGYELAAAGGLFDMMASKNFAKEVSALGGYRLVG